MKVDVARPTHWGFIDFIEVDPSGVIRVVGWATAGLPPEDAPGLTWGHAEIPPLQIYCTTRPDVKTEDAGAHPQSGLVIEYLLPLALRKADTVILRIAPFDAISFHVSDAFTFIDPHYGLLLDTTGVLHRKDIYSFGPPNSAYNPEFEPFINALRGRVLDFGCGSGAFVRYLRSRGSEAIGLELDSPSMRDHLQAEVREFITLYNGTFPAPFADKSVDCIFCSEVLEHIPEYERAVAEIARIARDRVILTVPDMSAIPLGFRHRLIPWHLLESTHVNFFTQKSLENLLKRHFSRIEFGRISPCTINETSFYVSLVAICEF